MQLLHILRKAAYAGQIRAVEIAAPLGYVYYRCHAVLLHGHGNTALRQTQIHFKGGQKHLIVRMLDL